MTAESFLEAPLPECDESLAPAMVRLMNTNLAWNVAGVGPQTRLVAEEAARRVGMRLEEWLDEAVKRHLRRYGISGQAEEVPFRAAAFALLFR